MAHLKDTETTTLEQLTPGMNSPSLLSLQFTQGNGEFSIGYACNHALLDQSSLLAFLATIANFYNQNDYQPKPLHLLNPLRTLEPDGCNTLLDKQYSVVIAKQQDRIKIISQNLNYYKKTLPDDKQYRVSLQISKVKLRQIQQALSGEHFRISSNDILNALLVCLTAHDKKLLELGPLECQFPMNVRPALNLDENHIGNYLILVTIKYIKGLAKNIKQQVRQANPARFYDLLNWYATLEDRQETFNDYTSRFIQNPSVIFTTNWTSFDYSTIALEESKFSGLAQPPSDYKRPYLCPIMQTTKNNETYLTCEFTTLSDVHKVLDKLNSSIFNNNLEYIII